MEDQTSTKSTSKASAADSPNSPASSSIVYTPSSGGERIRAILAGIVLFLVAFISGILFTIVMQTHSFSDTPLDFIQRPILTMSGIPADAHKEWLSFQQSFQYIDRYYYEHDKINHQEMLYHASEAAIAALGDRFTAFNRPQVAKANNDFISGKFVGVGIVPVIKDGRYTVSRIIDNSPVSRAGIKEGDVLVAVDGQPLPDKLTDVASISEKLQGQVGSKVTLTFERPGDTNKRTDYTLTRQELISPSVDARILPGTKLVYIEMTRVFGENTIKEFDDKVGALAQTNPDGYILDMRGNGGGLVTTAQQLVGRFLPDGIVFYEDSPSTNVHMQPQNLIPSTGLKLYDKPLVILVDGGSASATEIATAALHDRNRATVIGQRSYGKGSAQEVIQLAGDSYLRVTFQHWFTPNKINLYDSKGIQPDIEVVPTDAQRKLGQDPQLDRAIQFLTDHK